MDVDPGLVLGRSQEQLIEALLDSSVKHPLSILDIHSHPSDLILAQFSAAVYTEKKPRETDADYGKRLNLHKDWCLLATGSNPDLTNGYFGAAYVHTTWQQVVVAHRGTILSNVGALITDAFGIYCSKYTDCMNTAITFVDRIRQVLHLVNTIHGRCYNLAITGHSLGGWLAQVTTFTVKWLDTSNGLLLKNSSGGVHAKTAVFDSPGAKAMLEKIRDDYDRYGTHFLDRLDITVYVSAPNYVNTCGMHLGTVNRVLIDVSNFDWKLKWSSAIYTVKTHAISNFVDAFSNNLDIIEVLDWPKNREEFDFLFEKNALNLGNRFHDNFEKDIYDSILHEQTKRYNTEKGNMAKCYLKAFSDDELNILNKLNSIQKQGDVSVIEKFVLNKTLEIKKNEEVFPVFEIDHNNLTIICESKQLLGKLTHRLKQLMRWLEKDFTEAVEEQIAALSRTVDSFYRVEGQSFLDSLPKSSLNFTDSIGLQEFLLSDTARVLSIVTQDGELEMTRLQNIFSQLRENVPFSTSNNKYTHDTNFTFLDWPRLKKLLKSGRSPIDQNNLMMVDGSSCTTLSSKQQTFLNYYKQCSPSILKKLVFISSHPIDIFNSFENVKTFKVPQHINLVDLSDESQRSILRRKLISTGNTVHSFQDFLGENCLIPEINQFLGSNYFKEIATNDDYVITIKDTRPRLSDQQMPIFETNIKTDKEYISKCVNSPNTLVVMSRKELENLAGWEQLAGTEIILAEGDAEAIFRETCNKNQESCVYRLEVFKGDVYCKQIFNKNFYVSRKFFHRAHIDVRKFAQNKHFDDLFIVRSKEDKTSLLGLISDCKESETFIENVKVMNTKEQEAELIHKYLEKNLHFITICQDEIRCEIEWRYSHGSVESLQPCVSTESYDPIDEQTLSETERKFVIITDEPGMGKTTSMANLSRLMETPWVIYIELKNFQAHIRDRLSDELTPQNVASFLLSEIVFYTAVSTSAEQCARIEHDFLVYFLQCKTSTKRVVVMFDGFDEVDDYNKNKESAKEKLVKLFVFLVKKQSVQLFLATRTYLKESLEGKLSQFSTSFVPINKRKQLKFLSIFWRSCLSLELADYGEVEDERLNKYTAEVLRQAKQVLDPEMARFMGVPLQLRMLAEVLRPRSDRFIQSTEVLIKNINLVSAPNLYKRFIRMKYDIYLLQKTLKGKVLDEAEIIEYVKPLTIAHGELGFKTLFCDFYDQNVKTIENHQELGKLNRLGLVQSAGNGEYQFVHRTYAEYCCAQIVVYWIHQQDCAFKNQLIEDILLPKILMQPDSKVIRVFLNVELGEMESSDTTLQLNAKHISQLWIKVNTTFRNEDQQTALHIAVKERNEHIILLLLSVLKYASKQEAFVSYITQYDINNDTALHILDHPNFHGTTEDNLLCNRIMANILKYIEPCSHKSKEIFLFACLFNRDISKSYVSNYLQKSVNKSSDISKVLKTIVSRVKKVQLEITPLKEGLRKNNFKLAKTILSDGSYKDIERYCLLLIEPKKHVTCLHLAAQYNNLGIFQLIAKQAPDVFIVLMTRRDGNKKTPLHIAVEGGHLDIVKLLVKHGGDINTRCKLGKTALMYAAFHRHPIIVKYLISCRAEMDAVDNYGRTALYIASGKDNILTVMYLVKGKAEMNSRENDGWSALHIAVGNVNFSIVKYLIENGAEIKSVDNTGMTALHVAAGKTNLSIVKYLIKSGAEVNSTNHNGETALHIAAGHNNLSIVKCLIENGAEVNSKDVEGRTALNKVDPVGSYGNYSSIVSYLQECGAEIVSGDNDGSSARHTPRGKINDLLRVNSRGPELHKAVSENNLSAFKYVIESGADINSIDKDGSTALHIAASTDNLVMVKYCIDSGAEINSKRKDGRTALHIAVSTNSLLAVKHLIENGAEITSKDIDGSTALHMAVSKSKNNLMLVKYCINSGAEINSKRKDGRTALHIAVSTNSLSVVKYLIESRAEINSEDNEHVTALHIAVSNKNLSMVKYLIDRGAEINSKRNDGKTVLHLMADKDNILMVKNLIDSGADIDSKDNDGRTALHIMADKDNILMVKYLIYSGAVVDSKDNDGWTALDIAARGGYLPILEYLLQQGVQPDVDSGDNDGWTTLHIAPLGGYLPVVEYLLRQVANLDRGRRIALIVASFFLFYYFIYLLGF